jgi:hypothetical protein
MFACKDCFKSLVILPTCFDPLSDIFWDKIYIGYCEFLLFCTYIVTTGYYINAHDGGLELIQDWKKLPVIIILF